MFIDVQKVPPDGRALDLNLSAERFPQNADGREDFKFRGTVRVEGRVDRANERSYRLRGRLAVRIELLCSRCLESFEMPVEEELDLLYLPASENVGPEEGEERSLEAGDLATSFYDDERIDLGQMIREQVYLALPMKPLCKSNCRGLCPMCGTNLNLSSCDCTPEAVDPRFSSLKALLKS